MFTEFSQLRRVADLMVGELRADVGEHRCCPGGAAIALSSAAAPSSAVRSVVLSPMQVLDLDRSYSSG